MFNPPESYDVTDKHGGFTCITRGRSMARGYGEDTLWRPADVARRGTVGTLIPGTVNREDFWQNTRPVVSARYRLPGYGYPVKVWWHPTGERIA